MRDQDPIKIDDIRGMWTRDDIPPLGYGHAFSDVRFDNKAVFTRESIDRSFDLSVIGWAAGDKIHGYWPFRPSSAPSTPRYIVLMQNFGGTNGRLFDTGSATPLVPILSVGTMTRVSIVVLFDRVYISVPIAAEFVYVYDPSIMAVARKIGGTAPTTAPTAAIGAAGNCEPGLHLVTCIFETNTGFLTKPSRSAGISVSTSITVPAGTPSIVSLTNIPLGPAGTVKRHILFTRVLPHYDGNPENYRYYLAATIADNVTTIYSLSVFDSQLVQEMTYLYSIKEEMESGTCLAIHNGSLLVVGPRDDIYLMRVSNNGEPEAFSASNGFCIIGKGDGGRNQNAKSFGGNIYVWKGRRTYAVQPSAGAPNTWSVFNIDIGKGCGPDGVGEIVDAASGVNQEGLFVASLDGLWFFNGTYAEQPLSWPIEPNWGTDAATRFSNHYLVVDPITTRVFICLGSRFANTNQANVYECDYSDGLTYDKVKWSRWLGFTDSEAPVAMHIEPFSFNGAETSQLTFVAYDPPGGFMRARILNKEYAITTELTSNGTPGAIPWNIVLSNLGFGVNEQCTFIGYVLRGDGSSAYQFNAAGYNVADQYAETGLTWSSGYQRNIINLVTERLKTFQLSRGGAGTISSMALREVTVYGKPTWSLG